jgi:hypothetical protein
MKSRRKKKKKGKGKKRKEKGKDRGKEKKRTIAIIERSAWNETRNPRVTQLGNLSSLTWP